MVACLATIAFAASIARMNEPMIEEEHQEANGHIAVQWCDPVKVQEDDYHIKEYCFTQSEHCNTHIASPTVWRRRQRTRESRRCRVQGADGQGRAGDAGWRCVELSGSLVPISLEAPSLRGPARDGLRVPECRAHSMAHSSLWVSGLWRCVKVDGSLAPI